MDFFIPFPLALRNVLKARGAADTRDVRRSVLGFRLLVDLAKFLGGVGGVYLSSERLLIGCDLRGMVGVEGVVMVDIGLGCECDGSGMSVKCGC